MARRNRVLSGNPALLALIGLALLARVLVPSGWMPAEGRGFAITLCSGAGAVPAWIGADGKLEKHAPKPDAPRDHPCAFAGLGAPALGAVVPGVAFAPAAAPAEPPARVAAVAVGQGLAAPPPPATGPPASI